MRDNVLITGGSGLIGSAFEGGLKITSKDANLTIPYEAENVIRGKMFINKIDSVIHTAAKVGGVGDNMSNQATFFYKNIMMNTNIIESCHKLKIEKLVCFLSTCIFPDKCEYPLREKNIHDGPPHNSNYGYAYAKRMAEVQLRAYREQFGHKYVSVIPTNVYGPNDNFNLQSSHVVPALIHKCYLAKLNDKPLEIWGTGKPLREFVFSKDVAKITEWILDNYNEQEPIIISNSNEISINELVTLVCDTIGFKGKVVFDSSKPDGQFRKPSDSTKIKSLLPDFEFTKIEDGIKETVEWFSENFEKIRK
jgi:GDP-L-fucose synthase